MPLPRLTTPRLALRPIALEDANRLTELLQAREISENTLSIPHPYTLRDAVYFIRHQEAQCDGGEAAIFAISLRSTDTLIGALGLERKQKHDCAELGYWLGKEHWGHGYATEAVEAIVEFGFGSLGLHRIHAGHFTRNPASGRVLQKVGFQYEGRLRDRLKKGDRYENYEGYSILRPEWMEARAKEGSA